MSNVARVASTAANTLTKPLNVEDVFSTYLYTGTGSTQTITNGIDLSGEGGMVWIKGRNAVSNHALVDTERGGANSLASDTTAAQRTDGAYGVTFNSDGFDSTGGNLNVSGREQASWTFRKAPKFFDMVTYTGTGSAQTISHNLGSVPGSIFVKKTSGAQDWAVYHREVGNASRLLLHQTNAATSGSHWNNTTPTDAVFSVGSDFDTNQSGESYVAYLFAHNDGDGDFGPTGDQDIIKCGSYTGNGSNDGPEIDLGFEPQWVILKKTSAISSWYMFDNMRGIVSGGNDVRLQADQSDADYTSQNAIALQPTGFKLENSSSNWNGSGATYIYIAIRRGPMAVPESATDVFDAAITTSGGKITTGFVTDMSISNLRTSNASYNSSVASRLTGNDKRLLTSSTAAEASSSGMFLWDYNDGMYNDIGGSNQINWMWKRAPGFFDAVAYTGNGTAGRTVSHNLGVAPEMIWVKRRNATDSWTVYHSGLDLDGDGRPETDYAVLDNGNLFDGTLWNDTAPTATEFTVGFQGAVNDTFNNNYIAYLFASLDGVSKIGSYTGNSTGSTTQTIDCGFSSGARFVLVKKASATGPWAVFDTERGIAVGNDPYVELDSTGGENNTNDRINPHSSGFTLSSNGTFNGLGDKFIFYAIA